MKRRAIFAIPGDIDTRTGATVWVNGQLRTR